jgi:L-ribulose-5-phosphate 3-epimerase
MSLTRREFVAAACALPGAAARCPAASRPTSAAKPRPLCFFSKHLPELNWADLARNTRQLGFDGIDLTVRKGGHVLPERANEDLPKAAAAIRDEGLDIPMITTDVLSGNSVAQDVISTAGKLAIPFLKPGYYYYRFVDIRRELAEVAARFGELAELGARHGVQVGFHNHAGYVGAPVWDIARFIDGLDTRWAGYYFDACHAVTEGGEAGWKIAATLVATRIKMIAVKDFYWEKTATKGWQPTMCPLGEGMVPWPAFFQILSKAGFQGPISLHLEYEIPGSTASARQENTMVAARRDLAFLRARLAEAA